MAYWMSRDQRTRDNWCLLWAQDYALTQGVPLVVIFCLVPNFLNATQRHYGFMLKGLQEVESNLAQKNIPFFLLMGKPEFAVSEWLIKHGIKAVVTDFDPLRIKRTWKESVSQRVEIPFYEIDAHNIIPCWITSQKQEYGAYTIRPKIHRAVKEYLDDFPELKQMRSDLWKKKPKNPWEKLVRDLGTDRAIAEVDWIRPGEREAHRTLDAFIETKLSRYPDLRNDPTLDGQSDLSPYIHFGQLSAQRIATEVMKADAGEDAKDALLEELIVRRELADNFCYYNRDYDTIDGFPDWAKKSLLTHQRDARVFLYSREQFENAQTHDDLWNAAQMEMVKRGKMHGYMRMYWAKKILEWTPSPDIALETAIYLNDRYEIDGRDPNGYTGIAWSIGGVHDRAWNERSVFGKVRYMSYNGCRSKFNVQRYIERIVSPES